MTTEEAVDWLRDWTDDIPGLDGAPIIEVIHNSEEVRVSALHAVAAAIEKLTEGELLEGVNAFLYKAHRILANNNPRGEFTGGHEDLEAPKAS